MTTQEVVAANVRARLAWTRTRYEDAAAAARCSVRSFTNKAGGLYPFRPDELGNLAQFFGLEDPGPFYRVPPDFPSGGSSSAWNLITAGQHYLPCAVAA